MSRYTELVEVSNKLQMLLTSGSLGMDAVDDSASRYGQGSPGLFATSTHETVHLERDFSFKPSAAS